MLNKEFLKKISVLIYCILGSSVHSAEASSEDFYENLNCMALNIYHEARSESQIGQFAVAYVTLNRVLDSRYPNSICDVVYQANRDSAGRIKMHQCQFSWYCDGKSDKARDKQKWVQSIINANFVMNNYSIKNDPTNGSTMYHAVYVNPSWSKDYQHTVRIGLHLFYK